MSLLLRATRLRTFLVFPIKKKIVGILYVHENNKFQKMCQLINLADSIKKIIKEFFFALTYDRIKRNIYLEAL